MNAAARVHAVALTAHRVVGLTLTLFLCAAGLTGAILPFQHELERWIAPELHAVADPSATPLDALELRRRLLAQLPPAARQAGARVDDVGLRPTSAHAARFWVRYTSLSTPLPDEYFVDPTNGRLLGARSSTGLPLERRTIVPFLYHVHYGLGMGDFGYQVMGVAASLWTLDCFVGLFLTFPRPVAGRRRAARELGRRWLRAWLIDRKTWMSLVFSAHRAVGLWLWALLLAIAWSAVGFNLPAVHEAVMGLAPGYVAPETQRPRGAPPLDDPRVTWEEARSIGAGGVRAYLEARGEALLAERRLSYEPTEGRFRYQARSTLDISARFPATTAYIDARSGALLAVVPPMGISRANDLASLMMHVHLASLDSPADSIRGLISACGIALTGLAASGAWLWLRRRRRARRAEGGLEPDGHGPSRGATSDSGAR